MRIAGRRARAVIAGALSCAAWTAAGAAARADDAPTKEQCIAANESGQALRRTGKLEGARTKLLACSVASCPAVLRDDCVERLASLEKAVPTIVFIARDDAGHDIAAVKVTIDAAPFADRLDGSALRVDPGEHTFELRADGYAAVTRKLVLREGVKGRQEVVVFQSTDSIAPRAAADRPPAKVEGRGAPRALAYVLGGVGIVAIGAGGFFGLRTIAKNNDAACDADNVCANAQARRDAQGTATLSTIGFVAGGALIAGGVVVLLTSRGDGASSSSPSSAPARWEAAPMIGAGAGGLSLRAAFR